MLLALLFSLIVDYFQKQLLSLKNARFVIYVDIFGTKYLFTMQTGFFQQ